MADPEIVAKFEKMGMQSFVLPTPEEADAYIRSDSARWAQVVKTAGVKFD
jgi:tripartite-type tricarboxylate transporter receptor subunit TctC